jgi:ADP-heptose:LPS heptosyltransferase
MGKAGLLGKLRRACHTAPAMRILAILPTRLGDAVLATGCVEAVRRQHPDARFTLAASPLAAQVYGAMPQVERIHLLTKRRFGRHWIDLWLKTAVHRWSLVLDLRASVISYSVPTRRRLVVGKADPKVHRVAELGALLGLAPPPAPRLWFSEAHLRLADDLLDGVARPILAVAPTANWSGKIWPPERFVETALALTAPDGPLPNAAIAVLGAQHERPLANPVLAHLPRERRLDWIGRPPLPVLGAALARCRLFLGNDSGLMHLAAAAGCPTLGLFGPTNEVRYAPWGAHAAVVRTPESWADFLARPDFDPAAEAPYMDSLEVAPVLAAARQLLERTQDGVQP